MMKADFGFKYLISLSSLTKLALPVSWLTVRPTALTKRASTIASESLANGCKWHVLTPTILHIIWTASCDLYLPFLGQSNEYLLLTWQWLFIETYHIYYLPPSICTKQPGKWITYDSCHSLSLVWSGMSRHSWSLSCPAAGRRGSTCQISKLCLRTASPFTMLTNI